MQARKAAAAIYIVCFLHTFISVPINPQVAYNTNTKYTNTKYTNSKCTNTNENTTQF